MPEFLKLLPPADALEKILALISPLEGLEKINSANALGRIISEPIAAEQPLPFFRRSTVDGYAVRAAETYGASEGLPMYLSLAGEVPMGDAPEFNIAQAACALIHTGGMLPEGTDAVVMVENTQIAREGEVEILKAVGVGENVLQVGEDVEKGDEVFPAGIRLGPAEIGGLMALGIAEVKVTSKPRVGIISSGDEVVPPESDTRPGQVRDINSYTLKALVEKSGGKAALYGIVADRFEALEETASRALKENDMVIITAGSSASARDMTAQVIDKLGKPGVLVHGVNVRPGKPTILGICEGKPVIGLPGNPVSALVIAGLFVVPILDRLLGVSGSKPRPFIPAKLAINLSSQAGREDWIAVRLLQEEGGYRADPIFGKSNLIFTLAGADGLICIPTDANGLAAGEEVKVWLV